MAAHDPAPVCAQAISTCCDQKIRRAFTLIEVLVVVAIIALLAAILLPSLQKAREQATGAVCRTNMHQVMLGMHTYVAEQKVLPGTWDVWMTSWAEAGRPGGGVVPTGTAGWRPGDNWIGLPAPPSEFNTDFPVQQQALWDFVEEYAPHKGSLYRYVRNEKAYLCPKDKKGKADPEDGRGGGGNGRFSYTIVGVLGFRSPEKVSSFRYVANFQQAMASGYTQPVSIPAGTKIQWTASKMLALVEEHPFNNTNRGWVTAAFANDTYLAFRHHANQNGGMGMFAFLDGHVEGKHYPFFVRDTSSFPPKTAKLFGVDIMNEYKIPYSWNGNAGGAENARAFIHHFKYPYQ